jgi:hypothetical protein
MVDTPHAGATRAFTSGLGPRAVVAVIAVVIIAAAVASIEGPSHHAAKPVLTTTTQHQGRLTCRATAAVDVWLLRVNGVDLVPSTSDATTWTAELTSVGNQLFIEASLADLLANGPLAVHITWDDAEQHRTWTLWGEGQVSETISLTVAPPVVNGQGP